MNKKPSVYFSRTLLLCCLLFSCTLSWAAGARLYKSGPIQITADGASVWFVNQDNDSVGHLNTATLAITEFPLPDIGIKHTPLGIAVSDDGNQIWVSCRDSDRVYLLDGSDGSIDANINLPWGTGPYSIALAPPQSGQQNHALVTGFRSGELISINTANRTIAGSTHGALAPAGMVFADDQSVWITHLFAFGEHSRLSRVDFSNPAAPVITTFQRVTAVQPQQSGDTSPRPAEGGYVTLRGHPAQVPGGADNGRIWLPVQYQNIHNQQPGPDAAIQSVIRKVNPGTRVLVAGNNLTSNPEHPAKIIFTATEVHDPTSSGNNPTYDGSGWNAQVSGPVDLAFSSDGSLAYLLHEQSEDLLIVPTNTTPIKPVAASPLVEIGVGRRPTGIVTSPVDDRAFVLNTLSRSISVINLATQSVTNQLAATPITSEPFSSQQLRGAEIFHSSNEDAISLNRKVACASCHINAEHDGRSWDNNFLTGVTSGPRETMTMLGAGASFGPVDPATGFGQLHRSGDRDEVQDFEHTLQGDRMNGQGFLGAAVNPSLGIANSGLSNDLDALSAYTLGLPAIPRSPYRNANGSLTEAAVRGAVMFRGSNSGSPADAGCASCHVPATGFTDQQFHDVGQMVVPGEQELQNRNPPNHVNTPSLTGVWATPPYNGVTQFDLPDMISTLLNFANRPGARAPHGSLAGLTGKQLGDLSAFALSIDGDMTAAEVNTAADLIAPRIQRVVATGPERLEIWFNESVSQTDVENLSAWSITHTFDGSPVAITGAVFDTQNGDRVTLNVDRFSIHCGTVQYALQPIGPISDLAGDTSSGTANTLQNGAPFLFEVGEILDIKLGASGYENITVPVHDASVLSGLTSWSHGSMWFGRAGSIATTAFVRFDWRDAFAAATGVTDSSQILETKFTLTPYLGDLVTLEFRRVLQQWHDHRGSDFNSNPIDPITGHGGPTWNESERNVRSWNMTNARATTAGVQGDQPSDYFGTDDTAHLPDAAVALQAVDRRLEISNVTVTDAFRFWFDNPAQDYGYAVRLTAGDDAPIRFQPVEHGLQDLGAVLRVRYRTADSPGICGSELLLSDGFE